MIEIIMIIQFRSRMDSSSFPTLEVKNRGETIDRTHREDIVRWTGVGREESVEEAALE